MSNFSRDKKSVLEIKAFQPQTLTGGVKNSNDLNSSAHFALHPAAKRGLGIDAEEKSLLDERVRVEVELRLRALSEEAYAAGFAQGKQDGEASAETEYREELTPQYSQFLETLKALDSVKQEVYLANEQFLIKLIFQIAKQVTLSELKTDRSYVQRLTGQIIEKLSAKENIKIKLSPEDFANLDQLRDFLKLQFPDLKNVQIDVSDDLKQGGCKVETDLSRVNASVEAQFASIERALGEQ